MPEKKQPITVLPTKLFGVHNTDRMSDVISSASGQFFHLTLSENLDILRFHLNCLFLEDISKGSSNVLTDQKSDKRFFFFILFLRFVFFLGCFSSASCNHSSVITYWLNVYFFS